MGPCAPKPTSRNLVGRPAQVVVGTGLRHRSWKPPHGRPEVPKWPKPDEKAHPWDPLLGTIFGPKSTKSGQRAPESVKGGLRGPSRRSLRFWPLFGTGPGRGHVLQTHTGYIQTTFRHLPKSHFLAPFWPPFWSLWATLGAHVGHFGGQKSATRAKSGGPKIGRKKGPKKVMQVSSTVRDPEHAVPLKLYNRTARGSQNTL